MEQHAGGALWLRELLPGLLFGVRFHVFGHLYAANEIEIARRTQRASITFASVPYGD